MLKSIKSITFLDKSEKINFNKAFEKGNSLIFYSEGGDIISFTTIKNNMEITINSIKKEVQNG